MSVEIDACYATIAAVQRMLQDTLVCKNGRIIESGPDKYLKWLDFESNIQEKTDKEVSFLH